MRRLDVLRYTRLRIYRLREILRFFDECDLGSSDVGLLEFSEGLIDIPYACPRSSCHDGPIFRPDFGAHCSVFLNSLIVEILQTICMWRENVYPKKQLVRICARQMLLEFVTPRFDKYLYNN